MIEITPILLISISLGIFMKTADLLNEHGLKWFRGCAIIFGILWGICGGLLLFGPNALTMFWLATFLTYIIKLQVDYLNHGMAEIIILFTFFWSMNKIPIDWPVFSYFFLTIGVTGLFNKYVIEKHKIKSYWVRKLFRWRVHYNLIAFLFSVYTGIWIVFFSRILYSISYEITTYYGLKLANQKKHS